MRRTPNKNQGGWKMKDYDIHYGVIHLPTRKQLIKLIQIILMIMFIPLVFLINVLIGIYYGVI